MMSYLMQSSSNSLAEVWTLSSSIICVYINLEHNVGK